MHLAGMFRARCLLALGPHDLFARRRQPLRRKGLIAALAEAPRPSHHVEAAQSDSLVNRSTTDQVMDSEAYISPSAFTREFSSVTSRTAPVDKPSVSSSEGDDRHATARMQLDDISSARRTLFAEYTPTIRLRKSREVLKMEMSARGRANELRQSSERSTAKALAPPISPHVDVPLLPAAYLRQRAVKQASGLTPDDGDEDAERLQLAAARNVLAQSDTPQLFRCLRCFNVFNGSPQTLLRPKVQQMHLETAAIERNKRDAERISRHPRLRKKLHSVARQQEMRRLHPTGCPQCNSTRVQWVVEYIHHRTHHVSPS